MNKTEINMIKSVIEHLKGGAESLPKDELRNNIESAKLTKETKEMMIELLDIDKPQRVVTEGMPQGYGDVVVGLSGFARGIILNGYNVNDAVDCKNLIDQHIKDDVDRHQFYRAADLIDGGGRVKPHIKMSDLPDDSDDLGCGMSEEEKRMIDGVSSYLEFHSVDRMPDIPASDLFRMLNGIDDSETKKRMWRLVASARDMVERYNTIQYNKGAEMFEKYYTDDCESFDSNNPYQE